MHRGEREVLVGEKRRAEVAEVECPEEANRVVPTVEEEEVMGQDVESYLRERHVLGTPAERLIRLEYIDWAKRLMNDGEEEPADDVGYGESTGGRGQVESEEPEEGRRMRGPTTQYVPTENERREHNLTHYPHRTWCECCMAGRAVAGRHVASKDETDPRAGEFHFDYCFLKNEVREEAAVTLVGVDKASDAVLAHVVPENGTRFDWVAEQLDRDMHRFGYNGRVVVKSDGENAARDLMTELARIR